MNEDYGREYICFTKMLFVTYFLYKPECAIILDIPQQELAMVKYSTATGDVVDSVGIKLSNHEIEQILPLCNALEFEKYRGKEPDMSDPGFEGYLDDGASRKFIGITDSYIPKMEISMDYFYNKKYQWPTERIYNYLRQKYVDGKMVYRGRGL